jgi:beta-lactam-binding protein with PASTA domain
MGFIQPTRIQVKLLKPGLALALTWWSVSFRATDGGVPTVEGLTLGAATTTITGSKLTMGTVTQQASNTVATGNVMSQDPGNGSSLAQGSPVNLVISSGPQIATVPNMQGLTQDAATAAITEAKLMMGTVTQKISNKVATGNVITQDHRAGAPWQKVPQ